MITFQQALTASNFTHATIKNADSSPARVRRNGKTQTWKTRPGEFRIPAKHGLYDYVQITDRNASDWNVAD